MLLQISNNFNLDPNAPSMTELFPGADEEMKRVFPRLEDYKLFEEADVRHRR